MQKDQLNELVEATNVDKKIILAIETVINNIMPGLDNDDLQEIIAQVVSLLSEYKDRRDKSIEEMKEKLYKEYGIALDDYSRDLLLESEVNLPSLGSIVGEVIIEYHTDSLVRRNTFGFDTDYEEETYNEEMEKAKRYIKYYN